MSRMTRLLADRSLAFAIVMLCTLTSVAQRSTVAPANPMRPAALFTGTWTRMDSSDVRVSRVRMEAGTRTYWHVHIGDQVLSAEDGKGWSRSKASPFKRW
jgi:quercetin dioxygenase-like cupin family protein